MVENTRSSQAGDIVTDTPELTLEELCRVCGLPQQQIETYIAEGVVEPQGTERPQWRFSHMSLITVRRASRLERDLGVNAAGVALAFDLMAQVDELKSRLARFEQNAEEGTSED